ncbi:MAG: MscL family protein [Nocardioides sp.]|uniref:large conductance mechanosensitive channel protein MscL n=1 Tax=Nocardioides sp. TaxID=35761 RepID=UPI0039E4CAFF
MGGFKKFLLQGDLVSLAIAVVIGGAFGTVVTAFVTIIMDLVGKAGGLNDGMANWIPGGIHIGAFIVALISFVILAAVVYFFVVVPYTRAKERFFPDPEPGEDEVALLSQIRDALVSGQGTSV